MKDEIKEILENMKEWSVDGNLYFEINDEKAKLLYYYITNLQKENERLKKALCKDNIVSKCKYDYLKRQKEGLELNLSCIKDYKSRNEKAIEYIEHFNSNEICENITGIANILLNILQGVGKDES